MSNTPEEYAYLLGKIGKNPHFDLTQGGVDYTIYPDEGYIPMCSVCRTSIETATATSAIMPHLLCGCLWTDFAYARIRRKYPSAVITRNKEHTSDRMKDPVVNRAYCLGKKVADDELAKNPSYLLGYPLPGIGRK